MIKSLITLPIRATLSSFSYIIENMNKDKYRIVKQELLEEKMTFEDIVLSKNYPLEIHYVETKDGYKLKLYRICGGKNEINYKRKEKQAILIMHGILDSSDGWICNSEDKCIPYILANRGYDVWIGNFRGNKHSKFHNSLHIFTNHESNMAHLGICYCFNNLTTQFIQYPFHIRRSC